MWLERQGKDRCYGVRCPTSILFQVIKERRITDVRPVEGQLCVEWSRLWAMDYRFFKTEPSSLRMAFYSVCQILFLFFVRKTLESSSDRHRESKCFFSFRTERAPSSLTVTQQHPPQVPGRLCISKGCIATRDAVAKITFRVYSANEPFNRYHPEATRKPLKPLFHALQGDFSFFS